MDIKMDRKQEILLEVYKQQMAEIISRREVEFKILTYCMTVISLFAGATLALFSQNILCGKIKVGFGFIVAISVIIVMRAAHKRIIHEHEVYKVICQNVVGIWEHFKLFEKNAYYSKGKTVLPYQAKKFGSGTGFKKMLNLGWTVTIIAAVLVIISSFI